MGIDEATKNKMVGFSNTRHPKFKQLKNKYKRVETFKWIDLEGLEDENKKQKIKDIVHDVLKKEIVWIDDCQKYLREHSL